MILLKNRVLEATQLRAISQSTPQVSILSLEESDCPMMKTEEEAGRVLIVDDSEQHRSAIAGEVSKLGYDVEVAPSGARALQLVNTEEYDLVLLDVVMQA